MPENCRQEQEDDFSFYSKRDETTLKMYNYFLKQNFSNRKARQETTVPAPRKRKAENTRMKRCIEKKCLIIIITYLHK